MASPLRKSARPLIALLAAHVFSFYGAKLLNLGRPHIQLTLKADAWVPLVPAFVSFYVLAFAQWALCYGLLLRREPAVFRRVAYASAAGELLAFALFVAMPTTILRPEITGTGLWERLLRLVYACDTPVNLFPSLHCYQSWLCWRGLRMAGSVPRWLKRGCLVLTLLVCASTVLVKQHFLLDIPGGILCAELGLLLTRRLKRNAA